MRIQSRISTKLLVLFGSILFLSVGAVTAVITRTSWHSMEESLLEREIPLTVATITDDIHQSLFNAVIGLRSMAEDPFFKEWILRGENEERIPDLVDKLSRVSNQFSTSGANFVSAHTENYYNVVGGEYELRRLTEDDQWFTEFAESGDDFNINVYTTHHLYGEIAFINYRVDADGEFLGLFSVSIPLADLVERVTSNTIGSSGETFVINSTGDIVVHSNPELLEEGSLRDSLGWDAELASLLSADQHSFLLSTEEDEYYVQSQAIDGVDWILITTASRTELLAPLQRGLRISLLMGAIAIGVALLLTQFLLRPLIKSISSAVTLADGVSAGDLSVSITATSEDEIGLLVRALSRMVDSLRGKGESLQRIAEGDLTEPITCDSEVDALGNSLQQMQKSLLETLHGINDSSVQVHAGADQLSELSQSLAAGSSEQAESLVRITENITDFRDQSDATAGKVRSASQSALATSDTAEQGEQRVEELVSAMGRIEEASNRIGSVIQMIQDIAFQTNLLALNASVEAARAGKHGKGFAVVAEEVRNLARRSAKAVGQTEELIQTTIDSVHEGRSFTDTTVQQFQKISTAVSDIADTLSEVDTESMKQVESVRHISEEIESIDEVVQSSAAASEEAAATAEELASQTHVLKGMVEHFRLG
ncbi:methyl-accepting chemotaxis protein [Chitinivibrio alkaliphilus]|uniref:Methyl-accepting chemotaxis sensory transducer n=1 Tax=Chitinivibrio alkaliphilus ACht1 TaxID=1313304 RepID=U7D9Z7_9BACT|nr:methyl-accepting chemotaxis protein [Chitinivibrio alkaliphilus]ERP31917.1 methyl-accepting chemotaxis sensory transducer [Chitinivibrio alkaliphilus ACht1]